MTLIKLPDVFEEAETRRMGAAFEAAWAYIEESKTALGDASHHEDTREKLAAAVIKYVRDVGPDVEALRNAALEALGFVCVEVICPAEHTLN